MKKLLGIVVLSLLWFNTAFALPMYVDEDSSKWTMCEGTKEFNNNLTYTGEWKDNMANRKGIKTFSDGSKYTGEWKEDNINGQGTMTFLDGSKFAGEFKDGKFIK